MSNSQDDLANLKKSIEFIEESCNDSRVYVIVRTLSETFHGFLDLYRKDVELPLFLFSAVVRWILARPELRGDKENFKKNINLLTNCLYLQPNHVMRNYVNRLLLSISNTFNILESDNERVVFPLINSTNIEINVDTDLSYHIILFMFEFVNTISPVHLSVYDVLNILHNVLYSKDLVLIYQVICTISKAFPRSENESVSVIFLLIHHFQTVYKDMSENNKDLDLILVKIFKRFSERLSLCSMLIISKKIVSLIDDLKCIYCPKLLECFLGMLVDLMKHDNLVSVDLLKNKFHLLHVFPVFCKACRILYLNNDTFLEEFDRDEFAPSLYTIKRKVFDIERVSNFSDKTFLDYCSRFDDLPDEYINLLVKRISDQKISVIDVLDHHISIKSDVLLKLTKYLVEDQILDFLDLYYKLYGNLHKEFIKYANLLLHHKRMSHIFHLYTKYDLGAEYVGFIKDQSSNFQNWSIPEYRDAIYKLSENEFIERYELFLENCPLVDITIDIGAWLLGNPTVGLRFLTHILNVLVGDIGQDTYSAFVILIHAEESVKELYFKDNYRLSKLLYHIREKHDSCFQNITHILFLDKIDYITSGQPSILFLESVLIPQLVVDMNEELLTHYINNVDSILRKQENVSDYPSFLNTDHNIVKSIRNFSSTVKSDLVKDVIKQDLNDILSLVFSTNDNNKIEEIYDFLKKVSGDKDWTIKDNSYEIVTKIILNFGYKDDEKYMMNGLKVMAQKLSKNFDENNPFFSFWDNVKYFVMFRLKQMINGNSTVKKGHTLKILLKIIQYVENLSDHDINDIILIIDAAINSSKLFDQCIDLYYAFLNHIEPEVLDKYIKNIFIQLIPHIKDHFEMVDNLCNRIFNKNTAASEHLNVFLLVPEVCSLTCVKSKMSSVSLTFSQHISILYENFKNSSFYLQYLIIKQIYFLLQKNMTLDIPEQCDIISKIKEIFCTNKSVDFCVYSARCLALAKFYNTNIIEKNEMFSEDTVIKEIISVDLTRALFEKELFHIYDKILLVMQNLNTGDKENMPVIQHYISGNIRFKSTLPKRVKVIETPVFGRYDNWSSNFVEYVLLEEKWKSNSLLQKLKPFVLILNHIPNLGNSLLPLIIESLYKDKSFKKILRGEFRTILTALRSDKNKQNALTVMLQIFQIFDVLSHNNIFPQKRKILDSSEMIMVDDDDNLYIAACSCGLYHHALLFIENSIRHNITSTGEECGVKQYKDVKRAYKMLNEPDGLSYINKQIASYIPQNKTTNPFSKLKTKIKEGDYERVLREAMSLYIPYNNPKIDAIISKCAIRLSSWESLDIVMKASNGNFDNIDDESDFVIGATLNLIQHNEFDQALISIGNLRVKLSQSLSHQTTFNFCNICNHLVPLHLLEEIEDFINCKRNNEKFNVTKWDNWVNGNPLSADSLESILSVRAVLFNLLNDKENIYRQWISLAQSYRKTGLYSKAKRFLKKITCEIENNIKDEYTLELAKLNWETHSRSNAIDILASNLTIKAKLLCAKYYETISYRDKESILKEYESALNELPNDAKANFSTANFCDSYFMELIDVPTSKLKLPDFCRQPEPDYVFENIIKCMKNSVKCYVKTMELDPEKSFEIMPRILNIYFDISPLRLESFKSNNKHSTLKTEIQKCFTEWINTISPAILTNAFTQLISRVPKDESEFHEHLIILICKALEEFPNVNLWYLVYLYQIGDEKRRVYTEILGSCSTNKELLSISEKYKSLATTLKAFASKPDTSAQGTYKDLCRKITGNNLYLPLASTMQVPLNGIITSPVSIEGIADKWRCVNSLQKPKIITITASNGNSYEYLVKKDRDLRVDMRTMELSSFLNRIFHHDRRCRERNFKIQNYVVLILDNKNAMIEMVPNLLALGVVFEKKLNYNIRGKIFEHFKEIEDAEELKKYYKETLLKKYPPVLHKWHIYNFKNPERWFHARLEYIRTTSVWSMVGSMIGLGDRHLHNILISEVTGGVVHVDFNVIFDEGRKLPKPEIVPFRLTRNIVDAMGPFGTNGAFTNSCIIAIETMRKKKNKLLSVLGTFVNDPLLRWGTDSTSNRKNIPKYILNEIGHRLSGSKEKCTDILPPEFVLDNLIKEATNEESLALMYHGWCPHI